MKVGSSLPTTRLLTTLRGRLNSLDPKCNEPRSRLGDMAVVARKELPRLSLLRILQGVNASIPEGSGSQPCADIFALYVTQQR